MRNFGPGVLVAAAFIGPGTVTACTLAGANFGFALIWVCHHGPSQSGRWSKKALKIVGVYHDKPAAEAACADLLEQHEQVGHGDISVGGTWRDEIDLIIRKTPLYL